ncbi:MAG: hypothetical protein AAGA88_07465 [Pseudomonadota bacterium]
MVEFLVAPVVAGLVVAWFLNRTSKFRTYLDHSESRKTVYDQLSGRRTFGRYRARIRGLNALFDRWQGGIGSWQQFGWCLHVAFLYPIALLAIVWLFTTGATSGLLSPVQTYMFTVAAPVTLLALGSIYAALVFELDKIQSKVIWILSISTALGVGAKFHSRLFSLSVIAIAFAFAGAVAVSIPVALVFTDAFTTTFAAILLTFFLLLPVANSSIDWLSWSATRWFLRRMVRVPEGWVGAGMLAIEIVVDLGVAIVCLIALAVVLPNAFQISGVILSLSVDPQPFEWHALVEAATHAPFSEGLLVTGMLFTTLIPTIIHLVYGVGGVLFSFTPNAKKAAELFPAEGEAWNPINQDSVIKTLQMQRYWLAIALPITIAFVLVIVWAVFSFIGQFGLTLQSIALWSTAWSR